jgi:hypothetical protein
MAIASTPHTLAAADMPAAAQTVRGAAAARIGLYGNDFALARRCVR